MNHTELTHVAERWLKNFVRCRVVLREFVALTNWGEIPDAIGWVNCRAVLIEVKVSRTDFRRDIAKRHRRDGEGLGSWRFYIAPPGIIPHAEIPDGWGLYEFDGKRVKYAAGVQYRNAGGPPFESDKTSEVAMLVSALSRNQQTQKQEKRSTG